MNSRTKWLALGGAAVALLYFGDVGYRTWIEGPSTELQKSVERLQNEIQESETTQRLAQKKGKQMAEFASRSLPSDPALARSNYQDWLLKLVEKNQWESASVDASNPIPIEVRSKTNKKKKRLLGYRMEVSLRAKGTLSQLTNFLYEFDRAAHLHKITSIALTPLGNGSEIDINLRVETLGLQAADRKSELSDWVRTESTMPPRAHFTTLVKRNLFARGFSKALEQIRLVAITVNREGKKEAWFQVQASGPPNIVHEGTSLELPFHEIMVLALQDDRARININETDLWIRLGQSIAEASAAPEVENVPNESKDLKTIDGK